MHVNYRYVLDKCQSLISAQEQKILDYGCGAGGIVESGLDEGLEIYGVEAFYEGGNTKDIVEEKGLLGHVIKELDNDHIPFPDNYFDLVVSNQVFEHVADLDLVISEIHRVLKPEGILLTLFPSKEVIREGHCGIPFIHWFPKKTNLRYYWILLFRKLGFGYFKGDKSPEQWSKDFLIWLDDFTFYRSNKQIETSFNKYFSSNQHMEDSYIAYRLKDKKLFKLAKISQIAPVKYLSRWMCRKLAGLVILSTDKH